MGLWLMGHGLTLLGPSTRQGKWYPAAWPRPFICMATSPALPPGKGAVAGHLPPFSKSWARFRMAVRRGERLGASGGSESMAAALRDDPLCLLPPPHFPHTRWGSAHAPPLRRAGSPADGVGQRWKMAGRIDRCLSASPAQWLGLMSRHRTTAQINGEHQYRRNCVAAMATRRRRMRVVGWGLPGSRLRGCARSKQDPPPLFITG